MEVASVSVPRVISYLRYIPATEYSFPDISSVIKMAHSLYYIGSDQLINIEP